MGTVVANDVCSFMCSFYSLTGRSVKSQEEVRWCLESLKLLTAKEKVIEEIFNFFSGSKSEMFSSSGHDKVFELTCLVAFHILHTWSMTKTFEK